MKATENSGSFLNRISIRRNQVVTMENSHEQELDDLELFQRRVSERLSELIPTISPLPNNNNNSSNNSNNNNNINSANNDPPSSISQTDSPSSVAYNLGSGSPTTNFTSPLLSISWFRKLLDMFLCCEAEFKAVVVMGRDATQFCKPPLDRLIPEILDRSVKALDICNAVTQGIELVSDWQRLAQISVTALEQRPIGEGQVRRAKKALSTLLTSMMLDDKETNLNSTQAKSAERSWSFGRRVGGGGSNNKDRPIGSFRSLSMSVAKSWSAAKQIQSMSANLVAPRGAEQNGLALPVYIQSTVLVFVMWALVSAVPCQERTGLATHFQLPRNLGWAQPMISLQEKIGEEWKKKEKKGTVGLLEEVQRMEKVAVSLVEFADSFQFPVEDEKLEEISATVAEMGEICRKMEEGLVPLQQQVREVFHRIVRSRVEVLDVLDQVSKMSSPVPY